MDSLRLRDAPRVLWDALRRLLHALRRDRLLRLLRRRRPVSLLFVCHANLCRSPYAARVMSRLLSPALRGAIPIESAGFGGPGRLPPAEAVAIASGRGVDLSSHRSKLLAPAIVNGADLIWVMEPAQRRDVCAQYGRSGSRVLVLGDLDPRPPLSRAIQDPFGKSRDVYVATYERIDRCLLELARAVAAARPQR
jgi:protein-tyrosine phosphatase